ncbi:MAG: ATP-dependent DNA helicase RecG [Candidatus Hydrogenedentes bacterium]|nr:ATP-dependent DNA helicase RecG [Candidatus Hydrogenedentota bacterium]
MVSPSRNTSTPNTSIIELESPVLSLPGIGEKRAAQLAALDIRTVQDLLLHLPREYRDRSRIQTIAEAEPGALMTIEAEIVRARSVRMRGGKTTALLEVKDATGTIKVNLFGRGFLVNSALKRGTRCLFTGKVGEYKGLTLQNPEYEPVTEEEGVRNLHTGRIVPLYALTEGVSQRLLRRWMDAALQLAASRLPETLPPALVTRHGLPAAAEAIYEVHFPSDMESAEASRRRFVYEELLAMQLAILQRRQLMVDSVRGIRHQTDGPLLAQFRESLPFPLTPGQQQAVNDILRDMAAPRPMFRLLQGDVGCGKTLVALHAVIAALDSGSQTAFMAPTEILAEQHYATLRGLLEPLGIRATLLTGATPASSRVRQDIACGNIPVVVGTHALFQKETRFARLGLVIIDEQHRFGVRQRDELSRKGEFPDVLHTTATPIPRTLAITLYGGMDISVIPDLPPGRLPVKTSYVPENKKEELYQYLRDQATRGYQSYIVCPLVEESEYFAGLTPLIDHFIALSEGSLAGLRCTLLHGRLDAREKEEIMTRFKARQIDVLFSTTVIEVGVDSPTATTMVIEDAGRFGLTQLHQLRGRVGRGSVQSYCFLLGVPSTPEGKQRIELLRTCANGFEIAEADLELRGPGEYCGVRQAGLPDFRAADLLRDTRLLDLARRDAAELLESDPALAQPEHAALSRAVQDLEGMFV